MDASPTTNHPWRIRAGIACAALASLLVLGSALMKFVPGTEIQVILERLGLDAYAVPIALTELGLLLIYWWPRTRNLGFFLFCFYVGGITMAEVLLGDFPLPGLAIGLLILVGTLLRRPGLLSV